jgi:HEAT repeat protein
MIKRLAPKVVFVLPLLAGLGLLVPGNPAYLPSLVTHYSHYQDGHSMGYWLRALGRPDAEVRRRAIAALGTIGPDAAEAVPALATILTDDPDAGARQQAGLALVKMAPVSGAAVPALARALDEDDDPAVRMNAALALSRLRSQARPVAPVLVRALQRKANRAKVGKFAITIQETAALALARATAGTPEGVAALTEALEGARTAEKRCVVARALGEVGAPARAAEPRLRALLADDSPEVRENAEEALQKILGREAPGPSRTPRPEGTASAPGPGG